MGSRGEPKLEGSHDAPMPSGPGVIRGAAGKGKLSGALSAEWAGSGGLRAVRLAAAGDVDPLLEGIEADRADHQLGADHVARRAVDPERLGELHALLDRGAHLVAPHVLLDACDVESRLLGGGERARLVGLAAAAEQPLVEIEVLLARVLHADRDRDLG